MKERIKNYYRSRVHANQRNNFLWQVGKTVNGKEVPIEQIELIVTTIAQNLNLQKDEKVLDFGCGNGLLTKKISHFVHKIVGLDMSSDLLEIAKEYNSEDNISYFKCDILDNRMIEETISEKYSKVYLYEVIQHLNYLEIDRLFHNLNEITKKNSYIFLGGILDIEKQWIFFNTKERRFSYFSGIISDDDPLGSWYHKDFFYFLSKKYNMTAKCIPQNNDLYTSHYRFDFLLKK